MPVGDYNGLACNVSGLTPNTAYFYKFCGSTAKVGPTCLGPTQEVRTLPAEGTDGDAQSKLALLAPNRRTVTSFVAGNSPVDVQGLATPSPAEVEQMLQEEWDASIATDLPSSEELHSELQSLIDDTAPEAGPRWGLLRLPLQVGAAVGTACVGYKIGSLFWALTGVDAGNCWSPKHVVDVGEQTTVVPADTFVVRKPGYPLVAGNRPDGSYDEIPAPSWGVEGFNSQYGTEWSKYTVDGSSCAWSGSLTQLVDFDGDDYWMDHGISGCGFDYQTGTKFKPLWFRQVDAFPNAVNLGPAAQIDVSALEDEIQRELQTGNYPVLNEWLNHKFDPQDHPVNPVNRNSLLTAVLNDEDTKKFGKTTDKIKEECPNPVFHYTDSKGVAGIVSSSVLNYTPARDNYPRGAYASTILPIARGWTQKKLSIHLKGDPTQPSNSWVMFCVPRDPFVKVPGAPPGPPNPRNPAAGGSSDYRYIPPDPATPNQPGAPVHPESVGVTLMPAS